MVGASIAHISQTLNDTFCARNEYEAWRVCLEPSAPSCCFPDIPHYFSIIAGVYWMVLGFFGGIGNLVILLAIPYARRQCTDPQNPLRNCTTVLLLNLVFSQLFLCFVMLEIWGLTYLYRKWVFGRVFCKVYAFCNHVFEVVSIYSFSAATLSRLLALYCPAANSVLFESFHSIPALVAIWGLACILATIGMVEDGFGYNRIVGQCAALDLNPWKSFIGLIVCAVVPWTLSLICMILIAIKLKIIWHNIHTFSGVSEVTANALKKRDTRAVSRMALLVAAYLITTTPTIAIYLCCKGGPWSKPYIYYTFLTLCNYAFGAVFCTYRFDSYREAIVLFYRGPLSWISKVFSPVK